MNRIASLLASDPAGSQLWVQFVDPLMAIVSHG